jgi:cell division protein FtsQ
VKRPEGFDREVEQPPKRARSVAPARSSAAGRPNSVRTPKKQPSAAPSAPDQRGRTKTEGDSSADRRTETRRNAAQRKAERAQARRFTRRSRRQRLTGAIVAAFLAIVVAALAIAVFSPILALRTIRVDGATAVSASAVRSALSNQLGTPIALLNDDEIRHDLGRFVLIRSYVTEVVPPNTLVVRIVERQAIGVVKHGSGYDQVDPAGVVLARSATPDGLPVIDIGSARVGSSAFAAAVKVLLAMPTSVFRQISSVSATTLDNVSLTLNGSSHTVLWGSSSQSDLKAEALARVLALPACASEPIINVTAPLVLGCAPALPTPAATSQP